MDNFANVALAAQILSSWKERTVNNREKRDRDLLARIYGIESIYRRGIQRLRDNVQLSSSRRRRKCFNLWRTQFNAIVNDRVLFHKLLVRRTCMHFSAWHQEFQTEISARQLHAKFVLRSWNRVLHAFTTIQLADDHSVARLLVKSLFGWCDEVLSAQLLEKRIVFAFMCVKLRTNVALRRTFLDTWLNVMVRRIEADISAIGRELAARILLRDKRRVLVLMLQACIKKRKRVAISMNNYQQRMRLRIFAFWKVFTAHAVQRKSVVGLLETSARLSLNFSKQRRVFTALVMVHMASVWRRKSVQMSVFEYLVRYTQLKQGHRRLGNYGTMYHNVLLSKRSISVMKQVYETKVRGRGQSAHERILDDSLLKHKAMSAWYLQTRQPHGSNLIQVVGG